MNAPLRVAVAEDEPDIREFLVRMIQRMGYHVVCSAATGQELLDECLLSPPDLVVSDIRMPLLTGIQAAQSLWQVRPVPVILITAQPPSPDELTRRGGPFLVLAKPVSGPALQAAMRQMLDGNTHPSDCGIPLNHPSEQP